MDFPVEATIHLDVFRDDAKVRALLRSHDFVESHGDRNRVCVKGSFLKLKAVKVGLEQLLKPQNQKETSSHSSSPVPSGAISKYDSRAGPGATRGRLGSSDGPAGAHLSSPSTSAPRVSNPSRSHQVSSERRAAVQEYGSERPSGTKSESFVVDGDVFRYARQLRRKDLDTILENHNVKMTVREVADTFKVTLQGKSARTAGSKLQSLLSDLSKSLRTQEVPLRDMGREGMAFWERIRWSNNVYDSVLVREMNDRLHLIGSSAMSYQVKQKLLGRSAERPAERPGRAGRTLDKNSRRRSNSLSSVNRPASVNRDSGGVSYSSPPRAAGYSPSKYGQDKTEGAKPVWEAGAPPGGSSASRRRSFSESRGKVREERPRDFAQETNNRSKPPVPKQSLIEPPKDIKQKLKHLMKK